MKTSKRVVLHRSQPVAKEILGLGETLENGDIVVDFARLNEYLSVADVEPVYTYERDDPGPWKVVAIVSKAHDTLFGERRLARAPRQEKFSEFVKSLVSDFVQEKELPDQSLLTPVVNITETFLRTGQLSINTGDYIALNRYFREQVK
jgi:hypothetical protein